MKKEELKSIGNDNSRASKRKKQSSEGSGYPVNQGCKENSGLKKRVIIKNDGRYLIYYSF
ncbi:MAG TPA: hypothetical protein VIH07_01270 [Candidatus Humimicrobiaceae bacterium]